MLGVIAQEDGGGRPAGAEVTHRQQVNDRFEQLSGGPPVLPVRHEPSQLAEHHRGVAALPRQGGEEANASVTVGSFCTASWLSRLVASTG